jgi:uncharacterized membrane protein YozB (DUF420 family)/cytochrome oxidase Cu insertion factor (SCO1/SenC/PrrC family)
MRFSHVAACLAALIVLCRADVAAAAEFDPLFEDRGPAPSFQLTDRGGRSVSLDDLRGKVWVAYFSFTCCQQGCAVTNANVARLQRNLASYPNVALVHFNVYPQHDTPELLTRFAKDHGADDERWLFLTGAESAMYDLIEKGFHESVRRNPQATPGNEVLHTWRMLIVDHRGRIRGYIDDGRDEAQVARLEGRVKHLVQAMYLPSINAALNACCGLLLIAGYLAIRGRRIALHKSCMLSALGVSAVFLASYLYYHFVVQHGQPTTFGGSGLARSVYLAILGSHTVLAAVVAPLALYTAYQGLRGRLVRHVRVARWTLPIWLYVSATGIVVYWMLYHLYPPA